MMLDIFSSFDPMIYSSFLNFFLFSMIMFILIFMFSFWVIPTSFSSFMLFFKTIIFNQSIRSLGNNLKSFSVIVSSLFIMIIIMNLMGMVPYIFSISSHLVFTLSLSIPLWSFLIISSIFNNPSNAISILLPSGAPEWLNPFLILIETISISMRPITLGFRLAANMTAGHVVLGLMGSYFSSSFFSSINSSIIIILIQSFYIIFEFGICLIQSYIFCLLITLYANDHS